MNHQHVRLNLILAVLLVACVAMAGDWNPVGTQEISARNCDPSLCPPGCLVTENCDPSLCPPGCCSAADFVPCNMTMSWEKCRWSDVGYDEKGHVAKAMTERQARNIGKQYLEKYNYQGKLKLVEGDKGSFTFEVTDWIFTGKMIEVNRKNGWVRQFDGC